jgi:hypothetical protein
MNILTMIPASRRRADPDAADYFARIVSAGSTISVNNQAAVNAFIVGCKADGIWAAIKAACFLAGPDDLTGALVPLVGTAPTNNGPFDSDDYNRTTGLVGDGSTKYLDSNRANNADPRNSKHLAVWQTGGEDRATANSPIGISLGSTQAFLSSNLTQRFARINVNSGGSDSLDTGELIGFWGGNRSSSNDVQQRFRGTTYDYTHTSVEPTSDNIWVLARNNSVFSRSRLSFYSIGESLDLAVLDARLATYMSSIT